MCSFGEKNFFDTLAEVVCNALFDLVSGDALAAFIHEKRGCADFKRICNGFCVQGTTQSTELLANGFAIHSGITSLLCTYCTRNE
nr:MAG TPA: hypothetical protein [Caudoviricetes sp.]